MLPWLTGNIDRFAALGGLLKLEINALWLGPNLHRHDVQRCEPSGDPLALVKRADVIFDAIVARLTIGNRYGALDRSEFRAWPVRCPRWRPPAWQPCREVAGDGTDLADAIPRRIQRAQFEARD